MLKYQSKNTRDPNLSRFVPDYGQYGSILGIALCDQIAQVVVSVEGLNRLIGAVIAAPSKTPVSALEQLLENSVGDQAFIDNAKKLTGRLVRQVIEQMGGKWVRAGAKAPTGSRYNRGSIYTFG
jgi:hypothetical protein